MRDSILKIWFSNRKRWFEKDAAFDAQLREQFGDVLQIAARGELGEWCNTPHGTLAFIILCDQFSRNIHRGSGAAFATDALALHACLSALTRGDDKGLSTPERLFLCMPLMHSESMPMHDLARAQFSAIQATATADSSDQARAALEFEEKHRAVISMFGRYPARNAALGRASTPDELVFLQQPGEFAF